MPYPSSNGLGSHSPDSPLGHPSEIPRERVSLTRRDLASRHGRLVLSPGAAVHGSQLAACDVLPRALEALSSSSIYSPV